MNALKVVAMVLIAAGLFGIAQGGFSYVTATHRADIGPIHVNMDEEKRVNFPLWASIAAIVAGAAMLVLPRRG
jgi:hypothetical protein